MCICQECGFYYNLDINIPDDLWEQIKPDGKPEGSGLLCGKCIVGKLEEVYSDGVLFLYREEK